MNKDRVRERLRAIGLSPHEAAIKIGRGRNYIYDFLIGRKEEFKGKGPEQVASVLRCSVAYLRGEVDRPEAEVATTSIQAGVKIIGVVEVGAWRSKPPTAAKSPVSTVIQPDARYADCEQFAYAVRGDGMAALDITEPMIVCCASYGDFVHGHGPVAAGFLVAVERSRSILTETSIRRVDISEGAASLDIPLIDGTIDAIRLEPGCDISIDKEIRSRDNEIIRIVGVVSTAIRIY